MKIHLSYAQEEPHIFNSLRLVIEFQNQLLNPPRELVAFFEKDRDCILLPRIL